MLARRDFLRLAGLTTVGGSVAFLAACGDDEERPARKQTDGALLNSALDLEYTAVAAYTAGAALLKGETLALGRQFLGHEREHAVALARAIRGLGGTPHKARSQDEYVMGFPKLTSQKDVLTFAVDLANVAVKAYVDAIPKLSAAELRQTAAAIVSNEAEHIAVLLGALGKPQVPDAFVTGKA